MRLLHYVNQFFGGVGGEAAAEAPVEVRSGPVGPGRLLQERLPAGVTIDNTVVCGDGYFVEHRAEVIEAVCHQLRGGNDWALVAGPAFTSGRYGIACLEVAQAAGALGRLAVASLAPDNPAWEMDRTAVFVFPATSGVEMPAVMERMAAFLTRRHGAEPLGTAEQEGYAPRGIRRTVRVEPPAAERAFALLQQKVGGSPYATEIPLLQLDRVPPPPPVADLEHATVALVSEAGVVPRGNPDRLPAVRAAKWARYSLERLDGLTADEFESVHGGYDNAWVNEDPNRALPVDALRDAERDGLIGALLPEYFVTVGNGGSVAVMERMGREIAQELIGHRVTAVILPAT